MQLKMRLHADFQAESVKLRPDGFSVLHGESDKEMMVG